MEAAEIPGSMFALVQGDKRKAADSLSNLTATVPRV